MRTFVGIALLAAAGLLAACTTAGNGGTARDDLLNAHVSLRCSAPGAVELSDGRFIGRKDGYPVAISVTDTRFGDVTGDGVEEGLVLFSESCGAKSDGRAAVYAGDRLLGELAAGSTVRRELGAPDDRVRLSSGHFVDGDVVLRGTYGGPAACEACREPIAVKLRFAWDGARFAVVEAARKRARRGRRSGPRRRSCS
jgi:hypothetical protein